MQQQNLTAASELEEFVESLYIIEMIPVKWPLLNEFKSHL